MYPCIVVVLVSYHRSMIETFGFSTELGKHGMGGPAHTSDHPATPSHLSFAIALDSALDIEAGDLRTRKSPGLTSGITRGSTGEIEKIFAGGNSIRATQQIRNVPAPF